jgi:hypothetical protein
MTVEQAKENLILVATESLPVLGKVIESTLDTFVGARALPDNYKYLGAKLDTLDVLLRYSYDELDLIATGKSTDFGRLSKPIYESYKYATAFCKSTTIPPTERTRCIEVDNNIASFQKIQLASLNSAIKYLQDEIKKSKGNASTEDKTMKAGGGLDPTAKPDTTNDSSPMSAASWGIKFTYLGLEPLPGAGSSNTSTGISASSSLESLGGVLGGSRDGTSGGSTIGNFVSGSTLGQRIKPEFQNKIEKEWYMSLLPAMKSVIPMQGSMDVPGAQPGLSIKVVPNVIKHRIPGFQPAYQHLGVDTVMVTIVGAFTGADGESIRNYNHFLGAKNLLNSPDSPDPSYKGPADQRPYGNLKFIKSTFDSYNSFNEFYRISVLDSNELVVEINMARNNDITQKSDPSPELSTQLRDPATGNPKFKAFVRKIEAFHTRSDRTWYTMDLEVIDHGNRSDEPVNLTNEVDGAVDASVPDPSTKKLSSRCNDAVLTSIKSGGWVTRDIQGNPIFGEKDTGRSSRRFLAYNVSTCELVYLRKVDSTGEFICEPDDGKLYRGKEAINSLIQRAKTYGVSPDRLWGGSEYKRALEDLLQKGRRITYNPATPPYNPDAKLESLGATKIIGNFDFDLYIISSGRIIRRNFSVVGPSNTFEVMPSEAYRLIMGGLAEGGLNFYTIQDLERWINVSTNVQVCIDAKSIPSTASNTETRPSSPASSNTSKGPIGKGPDGKQLYLGDVVKPNGPLPVNTVRITDVSGNSSFVSRWLGIQSTNSIVPGLKTDYVYWIDISGVKQSKPADLVYSITQGTLELWRKR